ncbi:Acetyltransferase (GNAT) family protein [Nocardioides alpinus]|uniref:Acetyltransferase (GNAT) family protein n=1 Tax=Nocardioides alpinus TaxID=748909 RepID=A0A1I0XC90_9ACTN|nr:GNAT family N-acetyltransferase [Nocardioides alpinus]PKH44224.1 N-acetyltransferase [Nocardioides alpinus]SFA97888.1 Acetyltransferase (GNAT) family protein [Nocardioides alpinus]
MADAAPVRLRRMTQEEFDTYRAGSERAYALEMAASGQLDLDAAEKRSALEYAELLPDGLDSPQMHLWTAEAGDPAEPVGLGWIELRERSSGVTAWVYDVKVDAERRGRGLGRALMEALHDAARDLGATSISLNVFGHNATAIHLYESLGYAVTAQQMKHDL